MGPTELQPLDAKWPFGIGQASPPIRFRRTPFPCSPWCSTPSDTRAAVFKHDSTREAGWGSECSCRIPHRAALRSVSCRAAAVFSPRACSRAEFTVLWFLTVWRGSDHTWVRASSHHSFYPLLHLGSFKHYAIFKSLFPSLQSFQCCVLEFHVSTN